MLATLLLGAGCSEKSPEPAAVAPVEDTGPAYGDTLVDSTIGDAANLIAILSTDKPSHDLANLVFNGLVRYDGQYQLVGDLAESWEVSEDGLHITFHLRDGVRFHDGVPLTARDVAFTYQVTMDPRTLTAYRGDFEPVASVEVPDDRTLRVIYREPFAPALSTWSAHVLPRHLLEGADINTTELGRHPVGSGPYRFESWATGTSVTLARNDDYFRTDPVTGLWLPYLSRYVSRVIPDQAVQFNELLAGKIDRMSLKPLQWTRQTAAPTFAENYERYAYLSDGYTYLGYNLQSPLFQDVRVRRALTHAIDKEEIVKGVLLGLGEPATGPYKPGTWVYNPDVPRYPYEGTPSRGGMDGHGRRRRGGPGWDASAVHGVDQSGKRPTAEDGGDHPTALPCGRRGHGDSHPGVGGVHQ